MYNNGFTFSLKIPKSATKILSQVYNLVEYLKTGVLGHVTKSAPCDTKMQN